MPVTVLKNDPQQVYPFTIIGERLFRESTFVTHVALLFPEGGGTVEIGLDASPLVLHVRGGGVEVSKNIKAYACGWLEGLSEDDARDALQTLVPLLKDRIFRWQGHPPFSARAVEVLEDEVTKIEIHWYCSCAGFVLLCFEVALGLKLVTDTAELPEVYLAQLKRYYPFLDDPDERKLCGLAEAEPWRLLLPGYVINALAADDTAEGQPYKPRGFSDAHVPPDRQTGG